MTQTIDARCENCKYWHRLKYEFKTGDGFKESSCCVVFTKFGDDKNEFNAFVIETNADGMCEMFHNKWEV